VKVFLAVSQLYQVAGYLMKTQSFRYVYGYSIWNGWYL